ncbi:(d)CMP kinase [Legionella pneumophila]|uniref:Cytidylate kinase n=1 Tax=Legionella pneumophila subsp. pascullei TaxID=91890 RepID=A0AAX2IX96_LEGPN|nr:(d)CMP kinase [Legionella pneumophila]AMP92402.1 cytidylate kinase [Legionella pneumophila subsp. pascullei]AMP95368.1 cytidylate kinase [Legionella pneumophila subsp. pascullei]SQG90264.1 cytidylate kinase [Legionella pneumophila subsp. pascullei]VEH06363.1 cytidylate kinase [Legionella pneumophila subsp. pascullei]HDU8259470.1 (d)CMP kinase [Legionella pneumophila]
MVFNKEVPVITLDGPSGTGKGTICHLIAKKLRWNMLDSGAIYRVLAYAARKNNIEPNEIKKLTDLARSLNLRFESSTDNETKVILDDENVSQQIRSEQCGQDASQIAVIPEVRTALLERQRNFAQFPGLVTDGRDMGTVVFPNAILKVYLYASAEERANRRYLQLQDSGINVSLAQVVEELAKRDARDTARTHAPLKPAEDAVLIDTTGLTIVQVFNIVLKLIDERLNNL